jgi:glycosyltransferase involved in cell wall biosynthesis
VAGAGGARVEKVNVMLAMDRLGYDELHFHGAGRLMMEWTRALVESGVDVVTVILRHPGELGRRVLAEGLPFLFLGRRRYDPRTLVDMLRIMRRYRVQVVHLQGFGSSAFGRIAARVLGIPSIVHVHADHRFESLGYPWFVRWMDRLLAPGTSQVLAVSDFARDFAIGQQGFPAERVEVLYNPVDLRHFRPASPAEREASRQALGLEPNDRVAVCVTRFHPVKGIDVLVEAWAEIGARFPDARLLLVGEGPLRSELEDQVARTCRLGSVRFIGYRDDVREVLAAADLAVMPSRAEGFSVAALEILGSGLPLVATRVGGNPRLVADGVNGLLVEADDPAGLARALGRLLEDERLLERLADGARESVLPYDLGPFAGRLRERYEALSRGEIT